MSSQEFSMWVALYDLDQWGDEQASLRDDFRAGTICATVANFAGKTIKRGSDGLSAADFMPSLSRPKEQVAEVDPVAHFKSLATTTSKHK
jgi:hypothetical protein